MKRIYKTSFTQVDIQKIIPRKLYTRFALKTSVPLLYFVFLWYEDPSRNTYGLWFDRIYDVVFDSAAIPVYSNHFSKSTSTGGNFKPLVGKADVHFYFHSFHC